MLKEIECILENYITPASEAQFEDIQWLDIHFTAFCIIWTKQECVDIRM